MLGVQCNTAEAAEYTVEEKMAAESQEWKQYVDDAEAYTVDDVQTLENGVVVVVHEKTNVNDGIMLLTETVKKEKLLSFYQSNTLIMTFLETSSWTYGGAAGSVPYLGGVTYQARYANYNTGLISWSTPRMINLTRTAGQAVYTVAVDLTFSTNVGTYCCYNVTQNFS